MLVVLKIKNKNETRISKNDKLGFEAKLKKKNNKFK